MFERWEEHQHHSENVQLINEKQKQMEILRKIRMPTPVSKPVLSRLSNFIMRKSDKKETPPPTPVFAMNKIFMPQYPQSQDAQMNMLTIPQNTTLNAAPMPAVPMNTSQDTRPVYTTTEQPSIKPVPIHLQTNYLRETNKPSYPGTSVGQAYPQDTPSIPRTNSWFTKSDLRRRPLRTYETRDSSQYSFSSTRSNIKQKFMAAFGFSEKHEKPSGLRNEGQNLCFMNCILQCLSHTPGLVDKLFAESDQELDCSESESTMIVALGEILSQCQQMKSEGVLDPTLFREAISMLNGGLVTPLNERQHQQDAAEFFMWLMETLHTALNKKSVPGK